jgi:hypothetical protein
MVYLVFAAAAMRFWASATDIRSSFQNWLTASLIAPSAAGLIKRLYELRHRTYRLRSSPYLS